MRIKRRLFLVGVSFGPFALLAAPAIAQSPRKPARVAVLSSTAPETRSSFGEAFRQEMTKLGWVEGRDVVYLFRYARGDSERLDPLAKELVAEKPDLIFTATVGGALAAKRATRDVPIVFGYVSDPVGVGLVQSLARPGGNVTGFSTLGSAKYIELLKELRPPLRRVAVFGATRGSVFGQIEHAGRVAHVEVEAIEVASLDGIQQALDTLARSNPDGAIVNITAAMLVQRRQIVERIASLRIPAIYTLSEAIAAGGLMFYGTELVENFRRSAGYVDRILKGAKPADLPVQQPVAFQLILNMKAAREQGIKVPQSVLLRATKVVE